MLNHPLNAAGQLSYIYGTGALRDTLRAKGWQIDRTGNIESTYDPKTGIKIVFQNADSACEDGRDPKAISDKGPAAIKAVEAANPDLRDVRQPPLGPGPVPRLPALDAMAGPVSALQTATTAAAVSALRRHQARLRAGPAHRGRRLGGGLPCVPRKRR